LSLRVSLAREMRRRGAVGTVVGKGGREVKSPSASGEEGDSDGVWSECAECGMLMAIVICMLTLQK
jgi:hypothetical protein